MNFSEVKMLCIKTFIGVWRSLVARTAGGREVAGSNPVAPIRAPVYGAFSFYKNQKIWLVLVGI